MQDEIIKHGKKIVKTASNPAHRLSEKIKEIGVEIGIIVFAVSLSIWLHSWSEQRHQQQEVKTFLKGLKTDLDQDIQLLEDNKKAISNLGDNFRFLLMFNKTANGKAQDSIVSSRLFFDMRSTHANIGRYEGFKSSGKIGNITNEDLKQRILVFYEQTLPDLTYGENYVNGLEDKMLNWQIDQNGKLSVSELVMTPKMKSLFNIGVYNCGVNVAAYSTAIGQARKIMTEIDQEIK